MDIQFPTPGGGPANLLMPLAEAGRQLPVPRSSQTLRNWASHGIKGVRLPIVKIGGQSFVDLRQLNRPPFVEIQGTQQ